MTKKTKIVETPIPHPHEEMEFINTSERVTCTTKGKLQPGEKVLITGEEGMANRFLEMVQK